MYLDVCDIISFRCLVLILGLGTLGACEKDEGDAIVDGEIWIDTLSQEVSKDWTDIKLSQIVGLDTLSLTGRIKKRGGYSIGFPKVSYELDLNSEFPLCNLSSDDDWILNANCIDKTFLRHTVSYDLFKEMNPNNQASNYNYLSLTVNAESQGLYVLMEKLDKSSLEIEESGQIFKEPHLFRKSYDGVVPQYADNFHQQTFPKIDVMDLNETIDHLHDQLVNLPDNQIIEFVTSTFDIESILDWHLLLLVSNNNDGVLKNFYLYKHDQDSKYQIAPWDYDHSFGRDGDNELNLIHKELDFERSVLFSRLITHDWYLNELKGRWEQYNANNLLSVQGLKSRFENASNLISARRDGNFEIWSVSDPIYEDDNTPSQEMGIIYQYLELRHASLLEHFDEL